MATIKFGAIVTDMRGKLGGHVFQKGNQSRVMKTNSRPRQTLTATNQVTNGFVRQAVAAYTALTATAKNEWANAAGEFSRTNKFGDKVAYNGRQLFLYLYVNQLKAGLSVTTTPAGLNKVVSNRTFDTAVISTGAGTLAFTGQALTLSNRAIVKIAITSNSVIRPLESQFVYFTSLNTFSFSLTSLYDRITDRFGEATPNKNYWFMTETVNLVGYRNYKQVHLATFA